MRDTTESKLAQTRCKYKNCAKITSELSTMHMTFTSPQRFLGRFWSILRLQLLGASPPQTSQRGLCPLHPRWGHSPQTPYAGRVHTFGGAPLPSIPISATAELSIGTEIGDLEWPWTAKWPLYCVIYLLNLVVSMAHCVKMGISKHKVNFLWNFVPKSEVSRFFCFLFRHSTWLSQVMSIKFDAAHIS